MKNKRNVLYGMLMFLSAIIYFPAHAQQKDKTRGEAGIKDLTTSYGPGSIVRTVKQDGEGNIWIASWEGMFRYDGTSFTNVTAKVSPTRFFSVLEDRKGNLWFASVGSGVYRYDGKSFRNFTTKDGLANDRVTAVYEDKAGHIWFGTKDGASRYDGKSFRNLKMSQARPVTPGDSVYVGAKPMRTENDSVRTKGDSVPIPVYEKPIPENHWMHNAVNAITEDKTGKLWFGTSGYARVYDGKTFTTITNAAGKPFTNVRSLLKDRKGNIWIGGYDGLWRYDGSTFTNLARTFVGYIYEDKNGNIWTSSEKDGGPGWVLSRYDAKALSAAKPTATEITGKPMIFGILEDDKGNIWFGDFDGVHRYDGKTITDYNDPAGSK